MNYKQDGQLQLKDEPDLELKIIPAGKLYIVQVASPFLRGTLVLDERYEKEDLLEITSLICDTIDDLSIRVDENTPAL